MKLYETTDYQRIAALDSQCFRPCYPVVDWEDCTWWIGVEKGVDVCFCAVKPYEEMAYLTRAGVMPNYRGKGFQFRMVKKRLEWIKKEGIPLAVTDVVYWNTASHNNLIKAGFKTFTPKDPWNGDSWACVYWMKEIK